jgi:acetyl esterase/lipase
MINKKIFIIVALLYTVNCFAQRVIPLYDKVPNALADTSYAEKSDTVKGRIRTSRVTQPTLTAFFPAPGKANGAAVVICPGGGYSYLVMNQEGTDVAEAFVKKGIAAFVLKYRLPSDKIMKDKSIGPLQDAQQAIKMLRQQATEWNIDPSKIGIIGFSAGGHVASTASTHFNDKVLDNPSSINLRPDFSILVYAVISFSDSLAHKGSRRALLGADSLKKADLYSGEKQVTPNTPPAFLIHCGDDKVVPVNNSISYYQALIANGVKAELHIYPTGGHGFGLNNKTISDNWLDRCFNWMVSNKWIQGE